MDKLHDWLMDKAVKENRPEIIQLLDEYSETNFDQTNSIDRLRKCGLELWNRAEHWKYTLKEIRRTSNDYVTKHLIDTALTKSY